MLQAHDSHLKIKWIALLEKQHLFKPPQQAIMRNLQANLAFQAMGPAASNAVPEIARIYQGKISMNSQLQSLGALGGIGPAAFPTANPVFLDALSNSNGLRIPAAFLIGKIHSQPEVFVPALINALKDSSFVIQQAAADALGEYGPAAKSAIPGLTNLLNDPDLSVRAAATNALKAIDPIAAANAGIK